MNKITANEIFVQESGTKVRTRCSQERVTDAQVSWVALTSKLDVGDAITVQCMNHERTKVFWQRRYLVASRQDFLRRTENIQGDMKYEDSFEVRVVPETEWWEVTPEECAETEEKPVEAAKPRAKAEAA
jgi:hypothetical protein